MQWRGWWSPTFTHLGGTRRTLGLLDSSDLRVGLISMLVNCLDITIRLSSYFPTKNGESQNGWEDFWQFSELG